MTETEKFFHKTKKDASGCWLWTGSCDGRYGNFWFRGKHEKAHRVAFILFVGQIAPGKDICHRCDVTRCVNPTHLFAGTKSENIQDSISKGRFKFCHLKGEESACHKLSTFQVIEIRAMAAAKSMTQTAIAIRFGVGQDEISRIVNRKRWKHV